MKVHKLGADKIFDGYEMIANSVLMVRQDGEIEGIVPLEIAGEGVERYEGMLIPGFVNCHCHLELSHMKGKIPEGTGLVDFVFKVVTEIAATEEEIAGTIENGEIEMMQSGIVAVGDICNNTSTITQKQNGNLRYYNFIESSGWLPSISELRFDRAKTLLESFNRQSAIASKKATSVLTPKSKLQRSDSSIVPHAPYSVSENLWKRIQPFSPVGF